MKKTGILLLCVLFVAALLAAAAFFPKLTADYRQPVAADGPTEAPQANEAVEIAEITEKTEMAEEAVKTEEAEEVEKAETPQPTAAPAENRPMPFDMIVYDAASNAKKLSSFTGKPAVVNLWATWCGYCVQEMPHFNALYEEYGDRVHFLMVDLTDGKNETKARAQSFVAAKGFTFPVYYDLSGEAAKAYGSQGIPVTLLIRADGSLLQKHLGLMDEATLRSYLQTLLSE